VRARIVRPGNQASDGPAFNLDIDVRAWARLDAIRH
jgi:hypothetical protein